MTAFVTTQPPTLDEVLAYRHPGVVRRYAKEHGASIVEAEEVFRETLKWLYLCHRGTVDGPEGAGVVMTPELARIDDMWHTFILFTIDYAAFCEQHFGVFLHHVPDEGDDETPEDPEAVRASLERHFGLVHDVLGPDTLRTWYEECRYAAGTEGPDDL